MMVSILVGLDLISLPTAKIRMLCLYVGVRVCALKREQNSATSFPHPENLVCARHKKRSRMSVVGASNSSSSKMGSTLLRFLWLPPRQARVRAACRNRFGLILPNLKWVGRRRRKRNENGW